MKRLAALATVAVAAAACGSASTPGGSTPRPTVFAASSLTEVFQRLDPRAHFSFAGSDELADQLRDGASADVYAAASPRYPAELHRAGLVRTPRIFATNTLVLVVPSDNPAGIQSVADLARPGTKVVIGARGVPIGDYTREVLARLGRRSIVRNVVSEEQDAKGVIGKVVSGDADAGFVYASDAKAAGAGVRAIAIPARAQPTVEYSIALVMHAAHPAAARQFVARVLSPDGRAALRSAGFGLP